MHASNPETIYSAGSGDWTQARLITVSGLARTVPMSHRDKPIYIYIYIYKILNAGPQSKAYEFPKIL